MNAYSSMSPANFIEGLRDALIQAKASPLVLDQLDALADMTTLEADLEKCDEKLYQMERDRDDLREELLTLLQAMAPPTPGEHGLRRVFKASLAALERHGEGAGNLRELRDSLEV